MVECRQVFGGHSARAANLLLVCRQEYRADDEKEKAEQQDRRDREHRHGQVGVTDRHRTDRREEPPDRRGHHVRLAE